MRFLLVEATEDTGVLLEVGGGIMRLSPVALVDLTMLGLCSLLTRGLGISGKCLEAGAGVRAGAGSEAGPLLSPACTAQASASSSEMLNLGSCRSERWRRVRELVRGDPGLGGPTTAGSFSPELATMVSRSGQDIALVARSARVLSVATSDWRRSSGLVVTAATAAVGLLTRLVARLPRLGMSPVS